MALWRIRDFRDDDLDQAVRVWEESLTTGEPPVFGLAEVLAALRGGSPAVVALAGDELIGAAVSRVEGERAWVLRIALARTWRQRGLGSALLAELERRLHAAHVHRISALLPAGETGSAAFRNSGYRVRHSIEYFEKVGPLTAAELALLDTLGGTLVPADRWDRLAGMEAARDLVERRVLLPLSRPDLAARQGVRPPRAVLLFGPPGTGKATLARAVAARLGWPFVELPAAGPAVRDAGERLAGLTRVVVFVADVDRLAEELDTLLRRVRERDDRLLICATGALRGLDARFRRPGRFDALLPVGPPDFAARRAAWARYARAGPEAPVDLDVLAADSAMLTVADIERAARSAAQRAFERAVAGAEGGATTQDYLDAIAATRPSVSAEQVRAFEEDADTYGP